jgi:phosphoglycolate phosphatase
VKRLFLFDLDGTLVNTSGAGTRSLNKVFRDLYGVDNVAEKVRLHGKTDPAIFREAIHLCLGRETKPGESETFFSRYLAQLEIEVRVPGAKGLLAGVRHWLEQLAGRTDAILALGTGNLERGARLKLEPYEINHYFPVGGYGSDAEDRAELLRFGHRRASAHAGEPVSPDNVIVIGDTPHDVTAARAAGFRALAVATGSYGMSELKASNPDFLLNDLTEAPAWLEQFEVMAS